MTFDQALAARIRGHLGKRASVVEKQMFGGVTFMLRGNMCCGVHRDALIARVGPQEAVKALAEPHTRVFDLTGRPMKAWVLVEPEGIAGAALGKWVATLVHPSSRRRRVVRSTDPRPPLASQSQV